ncbi:nucleotidyltransferase family protein [Gordonia sp. NPDC003429]
MTLRSPDGNPGRARTGTSVAGVVLAAGAGTRFGQPKILAAQGVWLRNAVAALRGGGCDEVAVAMGAAVIEPPDDTVGLVVDDWSDGLSATVRAALRWARSRNRFAGVVLHVVDMPDVGGEVVGRLLDAAARAPDRLVRVTYRGRPGHPVYLGAEHLDGVIDSLDGDVGAARYLRAHAHSVVEVECSDLASGLDRDHR